MRIDKDINNVEIAKLLRSVAAAYEIKDKNKNRFKIIAYERAADAVEHLSSEAKDIYDEGKLSDVSGIGDSISSHLGEIFEKGKSLHFKEVMKDIPSSVFELVEVSGIGPRTAPILVEKLKVTDKNPLRDLLNKAEKGEIEKLPGFGKDSQDAIIASIKEIKGRKKRYLLNYAMHVSEEVVAWLDKEKACLKIDVLGSLRRKSSTVGDIDISVATKKPEVVLDHFCNYKNANRVLERGEHTASIILPGNIQVDLMVANPEGYGALLQHFTGSKHHNIALREHANKKGLSLSEYGIKKIKTENIAKFKGEKQFYEYLGMEWIPPELREDRGEIKTAISHELPKLIEENDIKADLQIHSDFDIETSHDVGASKMTDLVKKASTLGYEYIAFTEHNPSQSKHNDKQIIELLKGKKDIIEKLNDSLNRTHNNGVKHVYNSLEIDILPDGKLPLSEKALDLVDFALISIHSSFRQKREKMTRRIIRAFEHEKVKIFAHPTGRKLGEREGVEINWDEVFDYCHTNNKWIEINAEPMRLDLPDFLVKQAIDKGIKITLGTDAHHIDHMDNMRYGVYVARRGWARKTDIVNSYGFEEFKKMIE
jgi:DNA polymerase (family 10)